MRFIRLGPAIFFVEGELETTGEIMAPEDAFRLSNELETILVLKEKGTAILIRDHPWKVLTDIINSKAQTKIKITPAAPMIIVRVPDAKKGAELLKEKLEGQILDPYDAILTSSPSTTLVMVTEKPLTRALSFEDIAKALVVAKNFHEVYKTIVLEAPVIMLETKPEWNEITIKLYDALGHYKENIERLVITIEDLDLGFIVAEGWDWDYPRPLLKVPVYKLRLITWEKPERIKFLLKGLEYKGYKRLCDIDVIVKGEKLSWIKIGKFSSKFELATKARNELESMLSEDALKRILELEEKLFKMEPENQSELGESGESGK
ncbi:hypothetical protein A3L04_06985 [Thermococcus chitonophagus]|uniref:Uncharacterized protein n=1 Tax=Thermococcus chitonophagus TaxID=54262 RepID=A0A160VTP1_9EURY|nr:hypothetical protein [Thermococcus chitonophagus]ASJ16837.1 hypothetical protein A3L04_06985 [Thermococcus chitonophagus]CUX78310.1 hypothetical protein CHITON_1531 [Thermococcus chitonophagus]